MHAALVHDLSTDIDMAQVGWRSPSSLPPTRTAELVAAQVAEQATDGSLRLRFLSLPEQNRLADLGFSKDQLAYYVGNRGELQTQRRLAQASALRLADVARRVSSVAALVGPVVAKGWARMLRDSELPVPVDWILAAGFSPKSWALASFKAVDHLGSTVAKRVAPNTRPQDQDGLLTTAGLNGHARPLGPSTAEAERVSTALRWPQLVDGLTPLTIGFLGAAWFAVDLLDREALTPTLAELAATIAGPLQAVAEATTGQSWLEGRHALDGDIDALEGTEFEWASDILRLPGLT